VSEEVKRKQDESCSTEKLKIFSRIPDLTLMNARCPRSLWKRAFLLALDCLGE
jgi:hypothetical protein